MTEMTESGKQAGNVPEEMEIMALKGLEPVRRRPGMYIGDTSNGEGLHHCIWEIMDNSVDEAQAGFCTRIGVILNKDGSVTVSDNGRGVPVNFNETEGMSNAQVVFSKLHAGGKFNANNYKVSGGLHGVGAAVVNALSDSFESTITKNGKRYRIVFRNGAREVDELHEIGEASSGETGTSVTFKPSPVTFGDITFRFSLIRERCRELACLNSGLTFEAIDSRGEVPEKETFHFENGISELCTQEVKRQDLNILGVNGREINGGRPFCFSGTHTVDVRDSSGVEVPKEIAVDVAFLWTTDDSTITRCYTNNIPQRDGGEHLRGFRESLGRVILPAIENEAAKAKVKVTSDDLMEGMVAVVSLKVPDPKFSSQTKEKLVSTEARVAVNAVLSSKELSVNTGLLLTWIDENPKIIRELADTFISAAKGREAARRAKELAKKAQKDDQGMTGLPEKLADCLLKDPEKTELFLVEGDSASGSGKDARNKDTQAIMPLRGKVLNTMRAEPQSIYASQTVNIIIQALGVVGLGRNFVYERLRYGKIIIMTDADVDGSHIRTLLFTFFLRHMPELVLKGHIYIALPPLYSVTVKKKRFHIKDQAAMDALIFRFGSEGCNLKLGKSRNETLTGDDLMEELKKLPRVSALVHEMERVTKNRDVAEILSVFATYEAFDEGLGGDIAEALNARAAAGKWRFEGADDGDMRFVYRLRGVERLITVPKSIHDNVSYQTLSSMNLRSSYEHGATFVMEDGSEIEVMSPIALQNLVNKRGFSHVDHDREGNPVVSRFKGLGEMEAWHLEETAMNPETRNVFQVKLDLTPEQEQMVRDGNYSFLRTDCDDYATMASLMGSDVLPRRDLIESDYDKAILDV